MPQSCLIIETRHCPRRSSVLTRSEYCAVLVAIIGCSSAFCKSNWLIQFFRDYSFLPVTKDGYHVIFHALKDYKTSAYHFENAVKSTFMLIGERIEDYQRDYQLRGNFINTLPDACLNVQGPQKGLIILFDMKGVSIFHLMRTNLGGLKKFFHYLQECLPCKLHRIHVMNVVPFFDAVLKLIKPFMKPELFQMVCLYIYAPQ